MIANVVQNLIVIVISHGQTEESIVHAQTKKVVAKSEEANATLYASERKDVGWLEKFEIKIDGITYHKPYWINSNNPSYAPRILFNDINQDGRNDLVIVLIKGHGTGVLDSEVHVFHKNKTNIGEIYEEVLVDNPMAIILKNVKTKLTPKEAVVTIGDKKSVINLEKFAIPPDHLFPDIGFGSQINFDVVDNKLVASVGGQITPAMFIGAVELT